jgi:hypothetical protein
MTDSYYIDLETISLEQLCEILRTRTLLPSRVILREKIEERMQALAGLGIENVSDLMAALKTEKKVEDVAKSTGIPLEYLKILRREIGGYLPSPRKFAEIPGVDKSTVGRLEKAGIRHTRDYFGRCQTPAQREALSRETGIPPEQVLELTKLTDLSRIWGVGPVFARIIYESGIDTLEKVAQQDAQAFFERLLAVNEAKQYTGADFILRDIEDTIIRAQDLPKTIEY